MFDLKVVEKNVKIFEIENNWNQNSIDKLEKMRGNSCCEHRMPCHLPTI